MEQVSSVERSDAVMGAWYRRAREAQFAHYLAGCHYAAFSRWLGIPSIILSAATGTTLFATLQHENTSASLRLALGVVSFAAATLSALQTYLGFSQLAEKHRTVGATYGAIRREIEQYQALRPSSDDAIEKALGMIRKRLDDTAATAPDVSARIWARAQQNISGTSRPEGFRQQIFNSELHSTAPGILSKEE
jgi:Petal formation-expressed